MKNESSNYVGVFKPGNTWGCMSSSPDQSAYRRPKRKGVKAGQRQGERSVSLTDAESVLKLVIDR